MTNPSGLAPQAVGEPDLEKTGEIWVHCSSLVINAGKCTDNLQRILDFDSPMFFWNEHDLQVERTISNILPDRIFFA